MKQNGQFLRMIFEVDYCDSLKACQGPFICGIFYLVGQLLENF